MEKLDSKVVRHIKKNTLERDLKNVFCLRGQRKRNFVSTKLLKAEIFLLKNYTFTL